ncbi:hypothetical protein COV49_02905 [Candidatus Falkowbacteria bacterium CG11_big_fil_rev_8_21_14_0_20_39_10]|uniref:DUF2304 domain-containing protein n=1 Tax=Candidatus Falkowbacteria bacterium CG11_big_fil_rev_8_21_14_0_20_39_10 TaxID=1974570 RepID=A0A2M6K8S7_9BACT|nr:MAG: hypothetical protein COV49_02905 [Candidatus Falkowbacteria bacterium CG11_big_fil_rev_8_21_14_0_20_39_10]
MLQQVLALIIIAYFLARLFWQKQKGQINANEFLFWLLFWLLATTAIIGLKWIDRLVSGLGFSGSGIDVLFYIAVVVLFYLIFKVRLRQEKQEKEITKIVRKIALKK